MKKALLATSLLLPIALYSCGGTGGTSFSSSTGSDTGTTPRTASLTISAKFPKAGKQGEIGTAFIDENTTEIEVDVGVGCSESFCTNYYYITLTRDNPTDTISNIPVGEIRYSIRTYDSENQLLDYLSGAGVVVEGQNTLRATLIRAEWKFVDADGQPTSITLNGTMQSAQDTVTGFFVIPYSYYYAKKSTLDDTKRWDFLRYGLLWKGSNLPEQYCDSTQYCPDELKYFNQFIGPATSNNAIASDKLNLTPDTSQEESYDPDSDESNRGAFFFGLPIGFDYGYGGLDTVTQNGTDMIQTLNDYAITRVTDADTMEGYIIELLVKSHSFQVKCYDASNTEIDCPSGVGPSKKAMQKAVMKALSERIGKAHTPNCFQDLNYSGKEYWQSGPIRVVVNYNGSGDACLHPFTAKASQLPSTDLEIIIQKR